MESDLFRTCFAGNPKVRQLLLSEISDAAGRERVLREAFAEFSALPGRDAAERRQAAFRLVRVKIPDQRAVSPAHTGICD